MEPQERQARVERGVIGGLSGLLAGIAFGFGSSLKACLPDRPELLTLVTLEFVLYGFVIYVPAGVAGFLIGYFVSRRVLVVVAVAAVLAAFGAGYAIAHTSCSPI